MSAVIQTVSRLLENSLFFICLVVQGLYVKWRIVKLPEPDGERQGVAGQENARTITVLVIGDSAAAGVGVEHQDKALTGQLVRLLSSHYSVRWRLFAKSGETTKTKLAKLHAIDENYNYVLVSLGVNDITSAISTKAWLEQQQAILTHLFGAVRARKVILGSLPPIREFYALPNPLRSLLARRALRFTAALKDMVKADDRVIVLNIPDLTAAGQELDMASDGFHPGPGVYLAWANASADLIMANEAGSEV